MECQCNQIPELNGRKAQDYAKEHLVKIRSNGETWEIEYECPETGDTFIWDYHHSEYHGGGPPRLRKVDN